MCYEIKWTPIAKEDCVKTISYLYDTWGDSVAEKFADELNTSLSNLEKFASMGKQDYPVTSLRKFVISKQQTIYYTVFDKTILILNIVDNRIDY